MEPGGPRDSSATPALPASFWVYPVPANCSSLATQFSCFRSPSALCSGITELDAGSAGLLFQSSPAKEPCLHQVFAPSSPPWEVPILQTCGQLANNLLPYLSKSQAIVSTHVHVSHKYLIGNSAKGFAEIHAHSNLRLVFHCMNVVILPHYTLMKRKLAIFPLGEPQLVPSSHMPFRNCLQTIKIILDLDSQT